MQTSYLPDFDLAGIQQGYEGMLRNDYTDIGNRFQPMESALFNQYQNPQGFDQDAIGYATSGTLDALGRAQAQLNRNNQNRSLDSDEMDAQTRRLNLAGGAAMSNNRSGVLSGLDNRQDAMRGTLMQLTNQDRTNSLGQMGFLNGLGVSRDNSNAQMNQAASDYRRNSIMGALGSVAQGFATGNPVTGAIAGGASLLGSLF